MVRAVIFDMDGVVVDSEALHQATEVEALEEAGLEVTAEELVEYTGMPLLDILRRLRTERGATFDPEAVARRKREKYLGRLDELDPIDGAVETVRRLGSEYATALATSSHRQLVDAVLDRLDLAEGFDATVSVDDVENGKPDPEPFERAAGLLGVAPAEAVVIEDSRTGVEASLAGGFHTIGFRGATGIDLSAADYVATSMDEVERYVGRLDESDRERLDEPDRP